VETAEATPVLCAAGLSAHLFRLFRQSESPAFGYQFTHEEFNQNGSAADIDELETKLLRQMDGMNADDERRWN